jgi:hypothetical protein
MNKIIFQIALTATIILPISKMAAQEKEAFKPSGKVWGYTFGDYYFKQHADSANRGNAQYSNMPVNSNSFEFRRIYLGYDYNISEKFSTECLLSYEGASLSSDASRSVFVKSANVRWKNIFGRTDLVAGLQQTPAFPMLQEKVMGYRSLEKLMIDMRKCAGSTDLGVSLQGKLDSAGNYGYDLMAANGSGTKLETDKFKRFYGDVYAKFMGKKIIVDLYSDYERVQLSPYHKSKMNVKLFLAYQTDKFTIGVDAFQQMQENFSIYTDTALGKGDTTNAAVFGAGVFARGTILKDKLSFFVRADMYNPDSKFSNKYVYAAGYSAYNTEMFSVIGLDYTPVKNVHIIPNLWYNAYQSRVKGASGKMKSDYDLVPRMTLHYIFK